MDTLSKVIIAVLGVAVLGLAGYTVWEKIDRDKQFVVLQNKIAEQAVTIKVKDSVYEKLATDQKNLQDLLDKNTKQGKELADRLKETKAEVATLTTAVINANVKIDKLLDKPVVNPDKSWTSPVDEKNGPLYVRGAITAGPTADNGIRAKLDYGVEDLNLDLTVSQTPDGAWKADAAVPPPLKLEFKRVAVNSHIFDKKWYENFNFSLMMAFNSKDGQGGLGIGYKLPNFNITGLVIGTSAGDNHVMYGGQLTWFPWER